MVFTDGLAMWSIHGVRVPQRVVESPETLTVKEIQAEANSELQRVMLDQFGWDRYLEETGAILHASDVDPASRGTLRALYRFPLQGRMAQVLVCTCDSTGKTFHLEVPPGVDTCQQAAAWLADETELELLIQS
jgi:hypothetical protein